MKDECNIFSPAKGWKYATPCLMEDIMSILIGLKVKQPDSTFENPEACSLSPVVYKHCFYCSEIILPEGNSAFSITDGFQRADNKR